MRARLSLKASLLSDCALVHGRRMVPFLATVLEQLDLALEHISKGDIHNARFGVMLTDNAIELVFHQIAKDKAFKVKMYSYGREEYQHQAALNNALGRAFDA